ncbi:MAG: TonB-dependent receptor [Halioglobus sp.]
MSQAARKFPVIPLSAAVASATSAVTPAAMAESLVLEEVIVTARKRTESVQDIPASIQAISGEDIREMGARGMADYSRFLSEVNVIDYGDGTSNVVFRGATVDGGGSYVAQSTSSVYLDEISVTSLGSQPSVRMVDIQRVEALAGPQGTIYGSDAQAGTLRIITNKPDMQNFEAVLDLSARDGSDSASSWDGSAVFNFPIVEDTLALRVVAFGSKDGGYVDNVAGHTPDTSIINGPGFLPSGFGTLDNSEYVEKDWNDLDTVGWRVALKWDISEDWSATLGALHQETDGKGDSAYDPYVGDLEAVRFHDNWSEDEYDLYSLTIEGDLGFAQLVSATSYYDREFDESFDVTAYHHYWSGVYCQTYDLDPSTYYWYYPSPGGSGVVIWPVYCAAPTLDGDYLAKSTEFNQQDRFSQEIRLSAAGDTFDWLVGLYYEESNNDYQSGFGEPTTNDFQDSIALDYAEWSTGETLPDARLTWYEESATEWQQMAVFGEVVWHASEKLDLTFGGRYFDRDNTNLYFVQQPSSYTSEEFADGVPEHKGSETEFSPKLSVAYNFTDDVMGYALWTEGYRPGGTNRSRGEPFFPVNFGADKMTNYEAGARTTLFGGAGRANITLFYMDWEDYQLELVDPSYIACPDGDDIPGLCGQPWQKVVANVGDAHILGASMEFDWAINENFVFGMNAEWLEAENDATEDLDGDGIPNVVKGQNLPITPDWTGAAWLNYERPIQNYGESVYARLQWSYTGASVNTLEETPADGSSPNPQLKNDSYNIGDLILGVRGNSWDVSLFVNNLTDERAVYTNESGLFEWGMANVAEGRPHVQKTYTNRPREYGIRFVKRWGG